MNARDLAHAAGATARASDPVNALPRAVATLPLNIRRQANAVVEELDLLRFLLREAALERAIVSGEGRVVVAVPARKFIADAKRKARKS